MKPSYFCPAFAMAIAITLLQPSAALAQIGHQADSLEWMVAGSELIVRATVADVMRDPIPQPRGNPNREDWVTVTLNVRETLKGQPPMPLRYCFTTLSFNRQFEGYQDAGLEHLWFFVPNEQYVPDTKPGEIAAMTGRYPFKPFSRFGSSRIRLGPLTPADRGWSPSPPPIFKMNLDVLEDPKEILDATRAAVAAGGNREKPNSYEITLPPDVMQWSGQSGDVNSLTVPIDSRLEELARELINSPAKILAERGNAGPKRDLQRRRSTAPATPWERREIPASAEPGKESLQNDLRLEGVKALVNFKSDQNIALLMSRLNDDAYWPEPMRSDKTPHYLVRQAAYETLTRWGVEVNRPVFNGPMPATRP